MDVVALRLQSQRLAGNPLRNAADVVRWFGAVQAQDYAAASWAIGQRSVSATSAVVDRAFERGAIVRTHVLRPTWHFVAPEDVRWMLALTGPRVIAGQRGRHRQLGLDAATIRRAIATIASALERHDLLTRDELGVALKRARIDPAGQRLPHLLMLAELHGLVCSGGRRGKQFTYTLLDARVPAARVLPREEALVELARRYLRSHGPATIHDFSWWSGLSVGDARAAFEVNASRLSRFEVDGRAYWYAPAGKAATRPGPLAHLLPYYDEYVVAYRFRGGSFDEKTLRATPAFDALSPRLFVGGKLRGGWRRTFAKDRVIVDVEPSTPLTPRERTATAAAMKRYGAFVGLPAVGGVDSITTTV